MTVDAISNALQAVDVSQLTIDSGETGKFGVRLPSKSIKNYIRLPADSEKHGTMKHDYQVHELVVQGASQDNQVNRVQTVVGWFKCLKKAIGTHKKHASYTAQAQNVKPRRRGMYTFLYGGRVNLNTFYDYKSQ